MTPTPRTGAQALIEALRKEKVRLVFGYQGGSVIPLFDALARCDDIEIAMPRHEQAGVHAADAYARVTGEVGVVISTSGPGACNLVTGIANAYMDSVPLVAITAQVRRDLIGNDAFQEVDVLGITRSIVKHNYLVGHPEELPEILKNAFHIARTGRPGPVVVDIPTDLFRAPVSAPYPERAHLPSYRPDAVARINDHQLQKLIDAINDSERPLFYAGGGVVSSPWRGPDGATAGQRLREIMDRCGIPTTTTFMALGAIPSDHPLSLGMPGMHGTAYANQAIQHCDCLVALGARFDDRITGKISAFAPKARILQVDVDPTSVGKNVAVDLPLLGEVGKVLHRFAEHLDPTRADHPARRAWRGQIAEWKDRFRLRYAPAPAEGPVKPQAVVEAVNDVLRERGGDHVLCTEVGQHQMWAALYGRFGRPRRWVSSGGLGTMGFGLPAAIGAQYALPGATVVDLSGDGSLQMNIQEFATLAAHPERLPVNIVVFNNQYLGMVRQWQELFNDRHYAITDLSNNPDFVKVAEAFGLRAWRVETPDRLVPALREAFDHPGPTLVDVAVERLENVYPMVPAGEALDRIILGDE